VNVLTLPRDVQERLLGRSVREVLSDRDRRSLSGLRLLVTGGGGSLGAELARQLAACGPASLTVFEQSEYALFRIEREIRQTFPDLAFEAVLGDVSRAADIRAACRAARPHALYHAAAYKHVALTEQALVPAARTNVLGTLETVRAAREVGARVVLVSSDKAADPTSVMGATKRLAEIVTLAQASSTFRPLAVRFGNILGSSGSFLEVMARAVAERRNIPLTDRRATRFFMTAGEAVELVLKADLIGRRAEVFWLDMGDRLNIAELAERFIAWATPEGQAPVGIDLIGLRPGEKLDEELTTQGLEMRQTSHPRIWSARQRPIAPAQIGVAIRELRRACARGDAASVLAILECTVDGFVASRAASAAAAAQVLNVAPPIAATA
jgi:FlaA1/EpsC-like NDP-sugar epimerase